jgi:importin subunit beta-1
LLLQVIIQILSSADSYKAGVLQYADQIMEILLRVFASNQNGVLEEGMLAVGAFSYGCGKNFSKYMPAFYPYLKLGLMNHAEWQVGSIVLEHGAIVLTMGLGLGSIAGC